MGQLVAVVLVIAIIVVGVVYILPQIGGRGSGKGERSEAGGQDEKVIQVFINKAEIRYKDNTVTPSDVVKLAKEQSKSVLIQYDSSSEQATLDTLKNELTNNKISFEEKAQ